MSYLCASSRVLPRDQDGQQQLRVSLSGEVMAFHSVMHWMTAAWSSLATSLPSAKLKMLPCFSEGELSEMTIEYDLKVDFFFFFFTVHWPFLKTDFQCLTLKEHFTQKYNFSHYLTLMLMDRLSKRTGVHKNCFLCLGKLFLYSFCIMCLSFVMERSDILFAAALKKNDRWSWSLWIIQSSLSNVFIGTTV